MSANQTPVQPKLSDLLARFLDNQSAAHADGLAAFDPAEVTPYEAGPVQPIDPRAAWEEATAVLTHYAAGARGKAVAPPLWSSLVAAHEPEVALAFCLGNFPQLMRNFHQLLHQANLTALQPTAGRPYESASLEEWIDQAGTTAKFPSALVALATLRLAKHFQRAEELIKELDASVPAEWRDAWENEKAALLWRQGKAETARASWHAQKASVPVLFNRAMADLFCGDAAAARAALAEVVKQLPETSAWHHLARLYLTLAEAR
jgi:hypothetical protein